MTGPEKISQLELTLDYFKKRQKVPIAHSQSKVELEELWFELTGKRLEDPDRGIRSLHQQGILVKVSKGTYMYDPELQNNPELSDFTAKTKMEVLERDNYRCVVCNLGPREGIELHVDHVKAKDLGGDASVENGQTLCGKHNYMKKNLHATTLGKKMFVEMYEIAERNKLLASHIDEARANDEILEFLKAVLEIYEQFKIDRHIPWHSVQ